MAYSNSGDVSTRLRQAILLKDLPLTKRILKNNPAYLQNPDYTDKSNTSLHLAAQYGLLDIVVGPSLSKFYSQTESSKEHLISLGHDKQSPSDYIYLNSESNIGFSYNTEGQTPLHLAASHSHAEVVELLCRNFPVTVNKQDNEGCTPLHLASRAHPAPSSMTSTPSPKTSNNPSEDTSTIEILLHAGGDAHAVDGDGNTCLHYATAWGNLKAVRVLIQAGADPLCSNHAGWTPEYYSVTVQAEVYYRNLVAEYEKRRAEDNVRIRERTAVGGGAVRLVTADEDETESASADSRSRADSGGSRHMANEESGLGIKIARVDTWK